MSPESTKVHRYIVHAIFEYSERKNLLPIDIWNQFQRNGVVLFLTEHYDIQHTLSMEQTFEDIESLMNANGS
jgi:hypothetical protein